MSLIRKHVAVLQAWACLALVNFCIVFYHVSYFCDFMCILCVFYTCAAIGVIINDDDDDNMSALVFFMSIASVLFCVLDPSGLMILSFLLTKSVLSCYDELMSMIPWSFFLTITLSFCVQTHW